MQNNIFFVQNTYHIKKLNMSMAINDPCAYCIYIRYRQVGTNNTKGPPNKNIVHKYQVGM